MSNPEFEYYAVDMQVHGERRLLIWRGNDRVAPDSVITDEHGVTWFGSERDILAWARQQGKEVRPASGRPVDLDHAEFLISTFPDTQGCREFLDLWHLLRDFAAASRFSGRFLEIDQAATGTYERVANGKLNHRRDISRNWASSTRPQSRP
jgi:hypothetical protein